MYVEIGLHQEVKQIHMHTTSNSSQEGWFTSTLNNCCCQAPRYQSTQGMSAINTAQVFICNAKCIYLISVKRRVAVEDPDQSYVKATRQRYWQAHYSCNRDQPCSSAASPYTCPRKLVRSRTRTLCYQEWSGVRLVLAAKSGPGCQKWPGCRKSSIAL